MKKFSAFIFDFNGVLWWDSELQEKAWRDYSAKLRGRALSEDEMEEHLHGRPNKHTLEYLIGKEITDTKQLNELTQGKESMYRQLCLDQGENFKLSPGAIELLDYLKDKQVPVTIATASEITNLKFFFEHLNLSKWFEIEKCIYDNGIRPGKPDPAIYLDAAAVLNTLPEDCVVAEDSLSGIIAAYRAEIGSIIGVGPEEKHEKLMSQDGVKVVVEQLDEIIQFDLF
jgi:HAD superfamily hydrolase (TIGR01509 family)